MAIILLLFLVTVLFLATGFSQFRINKPLSVLLFCLGGLSGLLLLGGFFGLIGG